MATNTAPASQDHPPLARDARGNLIAIPDGTRAFRICIKTSGRPKEIAGADNRPLRFDLSTTPEEIVHSYGPDTYRIYALDELGKVLDFVTELDMTPDHRAMRNADLAQIARPSPGATSTDLRFALDVIAQMMRVNGEALRAVTEAQADWVKSIASSRGFFRNAPPPLPMLHGPARVVSNDNEDGDDEDDYEDEEPAKKGIYDVLAPFAEHLAPALGPLATMLASGAVKPAASPSANAAHEENTVGDLASRPGWEMRDLVDLNYASAKAKARKAARDATVATNEQSSKPAKTSLLARIAADPQLRGHFTSIRSLLTTDEQGAVIKLAARMSDDQQEALLGELKAMEAPAAAALLRNVLEELLATPPGGAP